jgi:hypothetical protein
MGFRSRLTMPIENVCVVTLTVRGKGNDAVALAKGAYAGSSFELFSIASPTGLRRAVE